MPQASQSGRIVSLLSVQLGNVYVAHPGDTAWTSTSNGTGDTPPLIADGVVLMAPNGQKMYFADGTNWVRYDPATNTVERWEASYGQLPVDSENNTPRLIETWRGRTAVSGLLLDPNNIFFSRTGDPTDWEYFPADESRQSPTQAVDLSAAPQGQVGDVVTCIYGITDDLFFIGCDSSIYLLSGDPMSGGQLDLITKAIGCAWGRPICQDPYGTIYFVSSKMGIYAMKPGELPVRISQPVEQIVQSVNTGENVITAVWDDQFQGARFFFTPAEAPDDATHLFFEARTQAWWKVVHANTDHDPVCCCTVDGNRPEDRVAVIGSWDGYVRYYSADATDDDGTDIDSYVFVGPVVTKDQDEVLLDELQAEMGESSGDVTYTVHPGRTAEEALSAAAARTGTWSAGRSLVHPVRSAAHAQYVKVASSVRWMMDRLRAKVSPRGMVRRRGG